MEPKDLQHIENIVGYCDDLSQAFQELSITYESFLNSAAIKAVLSFFVEHIGEEAGKLTETFRANHPEMDWRAIVNFRHHIVHAYHGVIADILWETVQNDIPELRNFCDKILNQQF